ncbi:MAG: hypothetical protein PF904_12090 [Kiritimatiellae bacterium]|jgi:hypothetical protein|nr:hypothetical protein [Kiritimatiellia bacterium]
MKQVISKTAVLANSMLVLCSMVLGQEQASHSSPAVLENEYLRISFATDAHPGTGARFDVLDKRTMRTWKQASSGIKTSGFKLSKNSASFNLLLPQHPQGYRTVITLEQDTPEFTVDLLGPAENEIRTPIFFPAAFESAPGDRVIVPVGEGISYPAEVSDPPLGLRKYYSGHGITMAFFAAMEDKIMPSGEASGNAAYMAINETPDNSGIDLLRVKGDMTTGRAGTTAGGKLLTVRQVWGADRGRFGYARRVRFVFFDGGGHVAICKRYRRHAQKLGLVVPFAEKLKQNPARSKRLKKLFGAANIWVFSGEFLGKHQNIYDEATGNYRPSPATQQFMDSQLAIYRDMRTNGMDRLLIGAGADAAHLKEINAIDGTLSSRYDIYQDVMDPEQYDNLTAIKNEWPKEAFPQDLRIDRNGKPALGWKVPLKKPTLINGKTSSWISCTQLCDRQAIPYARKRIAEELKTKPYSCRFIDVTACSSWSECWSPSHPTTRSESRAFKADLLALPAKEFNLVFGSETGHEAFVPMCDYFEGMLSLIVCRVPDAGRNMTRIWDKVPAKVAKYQTGESYRLPLFQLVYHDCIVSYWYWGDYNNKLPALWGKRDLFNALYGVPPMYVVTPDNWAEFRERIFASYRVAEPVSKLTAQAEMIDHRILTADRAVQQTSFANGIRVTVNFSPEDYSMPDGFILKSGASRWVARNH